MGTHATKTIATLLVCAMLPAVGLAGLTHAAEQLSGDTLRQQIPGAKIQVDTPLGSVVPVSYGADGTLEGKAGAVAFFLGSQKDRGKWWIEGSKLCQRWNTWFNGRTNCARVFRTAENRIEWIDQDGDKGTGTVVELSKPAPVAQPSDTKVVRQAALTPPATPASPPRSMHDTKLAAPAKPAAAQPSSKRNTSEARPPAPVRAPAPQTPGKKLAQNIAKTERVAPIPQAGQPANSVTRSPAAMSYRVVNVAVDDILNVRSGPNPTAPILSTIGSRAKGVIIAGNCDGEWCPVRHGQSQGWVNRYFLAPEKSTRRNAGARSSTPAPITYKVVRVPAGDVLNLRRRPDSDAAVVATLPPSANRIRLTGYCIEEWCPVALGKSSGWAHRNFLALEF